MTEFVDEILAGFRPCFTRRAAFEWFAVVVVGLLCRTDQLGVTSVIRSLFLSVDYLGLIGFFRSSAWKLESLTEKWCELVQRNAPLAQYGDASILVGDGVKKSKEGRRMPGVKRHHQESGNSSQAEYMWGHLFGGVGILAEKDSKRFCIPLALQLQDGVKTIFGWDEEGEKQRQGSHVTEMIVLAHKLAKCLGKTVLLLDRYFLSVPALMILDKLNASGLIMHIVTKAKSNYTAFRLPGPPTGKRGAPRKKGETVKLFALFESDADRFASAEALLYGKSVNVRYLCMDLLWGKKLYKMLRFVFVEYSGTRTVLATTDLGMDPLDVIHLYGKRFGIEVMFREMKQVVDAFGYRFWSKYMPKLDRFRKKSDPDPLGRVDDPHARRRIRLAVDAIEGYMLCAAVATGLLQMLSLRFSGTGELADLRYLRTYRNAVASEATVADFLRRNFLGLLCLRPDLPLAKILFDKQGRKPSSADPDRAA